MVEILPLRRAPHAGLSLVADERSVRLEGVDGVSRFSVRGEAEAAEKIGRAFGVPLPLEPWRSAANGSRTALWLGPDEWLLFADEREADAITAQVAAAMGETPYSWVDISHRNAGFLLGGPHVADVLNAGCPLPLSLAAFPIGKCTRTLLGKAEIVLWRTDETEFRIEVWRSFAAYVAAFIGEAAREHMA